MPAHGLEGEPAEALRARQGDCHLPVGRGLHREDQVVDRPPKRVRGHWKGGAAKGTARPHLQASRRGAGGNRALGAVEARSDLCLMPVPFAGARRSHCMTQCTMTVMAIPNFSASTNARLAATCIFPRGSPTAS